MLGFNSFFSVQACRQGLVQHLEHLLFYGADMDVQNASGNTALHVCALHNRVSNRNYSDKQCFQLGFFMQFFFWIKKILETNCCEDVSNSCRWFEGLLQLENRGRGNCHSVSVMLQMTLHLKLTLPITVRSRILTNQLITRGNNCGKSSNKHFFFFGKAAYTTKFQKKVHISPFVV